VSSLINRYLNGEFEQVWTELLDQGSAIQQEPLFSESLAVAAETMNRVRYNISLLVNRLNNLGYVFGVYPDGHTKVYNYLLPHTPPKPDIDKRIAEFESLKGIYSIPLSLRMFWKVVGDVNFIGYHPAWPKYSDPLVVYPIDSMSSDYTEWQNLVQEGDIEIGHFGVPVAPDYYHKDNISGGMPYQIQVPNNAIDGNLEYERTHTTFVNYLRICFHYGGFPGLQWYQGEIPKEILNLTNELLPI
jgi:hypothetical protein